MIGFDVTFRFASKNKPDYNELTSDKIAKMLIKKIKAIKIGKYKTKTSVGFIVSEGHHETA